MPRWSGLRRALLGFAALSCVGGCPEVTRSGPAGPRSAVSAQPATSAASASVAPPASVPRPIHPIGQRVQIVEKAMGTRVVLASYTTDLLDAAAVELLLRKGHAEIVRIERLMTTWRDDSEVAHVNQQAGRSAVKVGEETFAVIAKSLWISKLSQGTFDITFASMGKLWRFDQDWQPQVPDAAALAEARERIDYRRIQLDGAARTVKLARKDTRISLGGIAKGYAIDRVAAQFDAAGLTSFYAQAGGDLFVRGRKPDGSPWRVGVRDPRGPDESFFASLPVEDHAFSTAGDYERAFILDGKRYHHILDPRTGYPATASRSVTVWAKDALTADAIDDAVFILGPQKGLELVESLDDCGAVVVDAQNKVWISSRLKPLVRVTRKPSEGI